MVYGLLGFLYNILNDFQTFNIDNKDEIVNEIIIKDI